MSTASALDLDLEIARGVSPGRSAVQAVGVESRLTACLQLCRPRIAVLSAVAVAVGFTVASSAAVVWSTLLAAVCGVVCFVAASSTLNQVLERSTDALMQRTQRRALVQQRIATVEAVLFGIACSLAGLFVLALLVNLITAFAALSTMLFYVFAYTPLKSRSTLCTTVGAIPGAMPPVLGWLAAGGAWGVEAFTLFAIFFVWQFPHFLAIGWIYRDQYARAELKMLPSFSDRGLRSGIVALTYAAAFVPISCLPRYIGMAGNGYLAAALVLSIGYFLFTVRFSCRRTDRHARQLMAASLICLPMLLLSLLVDFLRLTS